MANVTHNKGDFAQDAQKGARSLGEKVEDAVNVMGKKADDLASDAGKGLKSVGDRIAKAAPNEGVLGQAGKSVSDKFKEGGRYLEDRKLSGFASDLGSLVKNNPIPAILAGLVLGVVIGRLSRSVA